MPIHNQIGESQVLAAIRARLGKRGALLVTAAVALVGAAIAIGITTGNTGATFQSTENGNISGTLATVYIDAAGGPTSLNLHFAQPMAPDVDQTVSYALVNDGTIRADAWMTIPNLTALSALNNLGTYAYMKITFGSTTVFGSTNLNDHPTCPPGSTSAAHPEPCAALPSKLLLKANVAPGAGGTVKITFGYRKLKTQPAKGTTVYFNPWPQTEPGNVQTTVRSIDGSGNGLPFQLVGIQPGVPPTI